MKRVVMGLVGLLLLIPSYAFAQTRPDFSGTWRMDPTRSETAMWGEPIGPVTVVITQTPTEIKFETTSPSGALVESFQLDSASQATNDLAVARWASDTLLTNVLRDIRGVAVTIQQTRRLGADGDEMIVDSVLEVQHGYTLAKAKNYGAGKDVYVRVRR